MKSLEQSGMRGEGGHKFSLQVLFPEQIQNVFSRTEVKDMDNNL